MQTTPLKANSGGFFSGHRLLHHALRILKYINCLHELCVTATAAPVILTVLVNWPNSSQIHELTSFYFYCHTPFPFTWCSIFASSLPFCWPDLNRAEKYIKTSISLLIVRVWQHLWYWAKGPDCKSGCAVVEEACGIPRRLSVVPRLADGQGAEMGGFFSDQPSADIRLGALSI